MVKQLYHMCVIPFVRFNTIKNVFLYSAGFSQDIPSSVPWQKISGPPILPPHLLQVILNKDTPVSVIKIFSNYNFIKIVLFFYIIYSMFIV